VDLPNSLVRPRVTLSSAAPTTFPAQRGPQPRPAPRWLTCVPRPSALSSDWRRLGLGRKSDPDHVRAASHLSPHAKASLGLYKGAATTAAGPTPKPVVWTSLGPLPRWVPGPTTWWAPGTTRLVPHGTCWRGAQGLRWRSTRIGSYTCPVLCRELLDVPD
jgi:hypothetical protein